MLFKGWAKMVKARDAYTVELRTLSATMLLIGRSLGKVATVATIQEVPRSEGTSPEEGAAAVVEDRLGAT